MQKKLTCLNKILFLVFFGVLTNVHSQSPNWGWGQHMTITGSGNLTVSVYDPISASNETYNISSSSYDSYIYDEGVLVWTKLNDKVNYMTYDYNSHSFKTGYSYISNSVQVVLSDGIVAFAEANDKVEYMIYDPMAGIWKTGYSYISSATTLTNSNGVVAWAEANDKVEYVTYNASDGIWETGYSYISNSTVLINNNGVVAWAEANDKVEYVVFDHNQEIWKTGYSYISNSTTLLNEEGVVAWVEENDKLEYVVYDPDDQIWKTDYIYVSSPVTGFSITDGTVYYTYSGNNYKKGYSFSSGNWQNNYNTELHCDLKTYAPVSNPKKLAFFSYMTVGANSHVYNSGEGTIPDRRLPFKQYTNGGNYNVTLQIYNSSINTTCSENVSVPVTGIESASLNYITVYPNPAFDQVTVKIPLEYHTDVLCKMINVSGQTVFEKNIPASDIEFNVDVNELKPGIYCMEIFSSKDVFRKKIIIQ